MAITEGNFARHLPERMLVSSKITVLSYDNGCSTHVAKILPAIYRSARPRSGLPDVFLSTSNGGGAIQASASESTVIAMLAARTKAVTHLRRQSPGSTDHELFAKMTFYTSDQVRTVCMI